MVGGYSVLVGLNAWGVPSATTRVLVSLHEGLLGVVFSRQLEEAQTGRSYPGLWNVLLQKRWMVCGLQYMRMYSVCFLTLSLVPSRSKRQRQCAVLLYGTVARTRLRERDVVGGIEEGRREWG